MFSLDGCNFTNLTILATTEIYYITFDVFLPYYLTGGLFLNLVLILALRKQSRLDQCFTYQAVLVCCKSYLNLTFGLFLAGAYWYAGLGGDRLRWFTSSYNLMFATMRLLLPMYFTGIFASLFVSVAMATDRVFALWKPLLYRNINHNRHKKMAVSVCILLSIGLSVDKHWAYLILPDATYGYTLTMNKDYYAVPWAQTLENTRTGLRLGLVVVLIILNILMVLAYKRRVRKLETMATQNQEKAKAKKEAKRDLFILSMCQSCLTCLEQGPHAITIMMKQMSTYWSKCTLAMAPEIDSAIMLVSAVEFFLVMLINRKVRHRVFGHVLVMKAICLRICGKTSQVVPLGSQTPNIRQGAQRS